MFSTTLQIVALSFAASQNSPAAAYATHCDPTPTYHQLFPARNHVLVEQITSCFYIPPVVNNNVSITITLTFTPSQIPDCLSPIRTVFPITLLTIHRLGSNKAVTYSSVYTCLADAEAYRCLCT